MTHPTHGLDPNALGAALNAFDDEHVVGAPVDFDAFKTGLTVYVAALQKQEVVPAAWIIHDDPELGDYLTRSADAAKRAGLPVTPLYASPQTVGVGVKGLHEDDALGLETRAHFLETADAEDLAEEIASTLVVMRGSAARIRTALSQNPGTSAAPSYWHNGVGQLLSAADKAKFMADEKEQHWASRFTEPLYTSPQTTALEPRASDRGAVDRRVVRWQPRGIGSNWGIPDLITGADDGKLHPDMSGFVNSKAEGELAVDIFGGNAFLDWRPSEPKWIQVKVSAPEPVLAELERLVRANDNLLTPDIVAAAIRKLSEISHE